MRILVTGSRDWDDVELIREKLFIHGWHGDTLIVGDCPTGADAIAREIWGNRGPIEVHQADWERLGKRAGPLRNIEMVNSGADRCLAFIKANSKGATMTANIAEMVGISTYRWHSD